MRPKTNVIEIFCRNVDVRPSKASGANGRKKQRDTRFGIKRGEGRKNEGKKDSPGCVRAELKEEKVTE